jgi:hypothetical protein
MDRMLGLQATLIHHYLHGGELLPLKQHRVLVQPISLISFHVTSAAMHATFNAASIQELHAPIQIVMVSFLSFTLSTDGNRFSDFAPETRLPQQQLSNVGLLCEH